MVSAVKAHGRRDFDKRRFVHGRGRRGFDKRRFVHGRGRRGFSNAVVVSTCMVCGFLPWTPNTGKFNEKNELAICKNQLRLTAETQKKFYRLNRVPWGSWGTPMVVKNFIRFLDVLASISAQQKFPDKRFSQKFPTFFLKEKTE